MMTLFFDPVLIITMRPLASWRSAWQFCRLIMSALTSPHPGTTWYFRAPWPSTTPSAAVACRASASRAQKVAERMTVQSMGFAARECGGVVDVAWVNAIHGGDDTRPLSHRSAAWCGTSAMSLDNHGKEMDEGDSRLDLRPYPTS